MDSPKKICSQCGATKDFTRANFGVNTASPDGYRNICKECYSDNRYGDKTKAVQALRVHDKKVAKAQRELKDNLANLSPGQIEKYDRIVRLDGEHRAELQKKILDARQAEELAQRQASAAPSLTFVQAHFGNPILSSDEELRAQLEKANRALTNLTGADDGTAVDYVKAYIDRVTEILTVHDERAAFLAKDAQDTLNARAIEKAVGKLHDIFLPKIRTAVTVAAKEALREKLRTLKKSMLALAKTAGLKDKDGAEKHIVAAAIARALEKLALQCYGGEDAPVPTMDTLANIESRLDYANAQQEWLEVEEAKRRAYWDELKISDFTRWERESKSLALQTKGSGIFADIQRKSMATLKRENPAEYERQALAALKPRNVEPLHLVYVVVEGKRETWLWPDGRFVKRGGSVETNEVVYDTRLKMWAMAPSPVGVELDSPLAAHQKLEWYQDEFDADEDGPKWKQRPEGSTQYVQQNDGTWKRTDTPTLWTKPERLTFRKADPQPDAEHSVFKHGIWWTPAEVAEADAAVADNPPSLLPPLSQFAVSDSVAVPPQREPTPEEIERMNREPSVWKRWEHKQREDKEREAALLRGK